MTGNYEVIVVGGGITGAGLVRDCALRGLKTLLIEKSAPGRATTAASTHLVHGGLRYLLYDRMTTHATSWDAGNIVRIAGPLLTRVPLLWPLYRGQRYGPETVETLIESYDPFQRMKGGLPHLRIGPETAVELVPGLARDGLLGAVSFDEWWVDPVALVEANIASAEKAGARTRTGEEVVELTRDASGSVTGVKTVDASGKSSEYAGRVVVNAGGPWADSVAGMAGADIPLRLRKGTHLVFESGLVPVGLLIEAVDRDRFIFVVPFEGGTLVGPTDLPHEAGPDALETTADETRYLLDSVKRWLPGFPTKFRSTTVGARPILAQAGSEKLLSREFEVVDHAETSGIGGFVTVAGGKLSDFRLMARSTVDLVCRKLDKDAPCRTHKITLDGRPITTIPQFPRPWKPLVRFLRRFPRLRELYALAHLAWAFALHLLSRLLTPRPLSTAAQFRKHYGIERVLDHPDDFLRKSSG